MTVDLPGAYSFPGVLAVPVLAALAVVLVLVVRGWRTRRRTRPPRTRTPAAVIVAGVSAVACTAYSADTSWRFADHNLDMVDATERLAMFAAGELALFAMALLARQNLRTVGAPGAPGALVWAISAVQAVCAYAESGPVGGTVRAAFGPILAVIMWHFAMGIELRHIKPGSLSRGLAATIGRELRERTLSWLGLTTRDRTAEQITRDRAITRAARLAARPKLRAYGRMRLAAAVARSGAGRDEDQTRRLLDTLAARRHAPALATVPLPSPWQPTLPGPTSVPVLLPQPAPVLNGVHRTPQPVPVPAAPRTPKPAPAVPPPPVPPSIDVLVAQARAKWGTAIPSIRDLRAEYGIGQRRATHIQDELKAGPKP